MCQNLPLKAIYLKSLTPFEILQISTKYTCISGSLQDRASYVELWRSAVSRRGDEKSFKKYCDLFNLSKNDINLMTSRIRDIKEEIEYPFWIDTLRLVMKGTNKEILTRHKRTATEEVPFEHIFYPFINYFNDRVSKGWKMSGTPIPDSSILQQLEQTLLTELSRLGQLALLDAFSEFKEKSQIEKDLEKVSQSNYLYRKFISKHWSDSYKSLFQEYSVLARKLAAMTYRFSNFAQGIFEKLHRDKSAIRYIFNLKLYDLKSIYLNAGDQHNGETTAILEFENNEKVVYKPGSLSTTKVYNRLLDWVNIKLNTELKQFEVIDKGTYGWLQFVDDEECKHEKDVKLFFEKAGVLLGIAYFLNSRDYHYENVIASGNSPVLIDHETIVGPTLKTSVQGKSGKPTIERITGSILESLLLPLDVEDIPSYVCGLGSSVMLSVNTSESAIVNCNQDDMKRTVRLKITNLYKSNKPCLGGKIKSLVNYQDELKRGFNKLYRLFLNNKNFLTSEASLLNDFKGQQIRHICRFTRVYYEIQKLLNQPEYMRDAIRYGLKLELLARAYLKQPELKALLKSERLQMLSGDIPAFYTNTSANQFELPDGEVLDIFELNTIDSIHSKIRNASLNDYDHQLNLINQVVHF